MTSAVHQNFDYTNLPERFTREMGCDAHYIQSRLAEASRHLPILPQADSAVVQMKQGTLTLTWQTLAPRRIALMSAPRLLVSFAFEGVPLEERIDYMRYFDLYTRRGGG